MGVVGSSPTGSTNYTSVAQLAELAALNREVVGSNPTGGTFNNGGGARLVVAGAC